MRIKLEERRKTNKFSGETVPIELIGDILCDVRIVNSKLLDAVLELLAAVKEGTEIAKEGIELAKETAIKIQEVKEAIENAPIGTGPKTNNSMDES